MKKISSDRTGFYKKVFPVICVAAPVLVMAVTAAFGNFRKSAFLILFPSAMIVMVYLFFKKLIWVMVDEVYDCGDSLLVRNRGQEAMFPLSNITYVDAPMQVNPPRVTLRLAVLSIFGNEITFSPARSFSLNPFAKDKMIDDLIERIDQARSRRRTWAAASRLRRDGAQRLRYRCAKRSVFPRTAGSKTNFDRSSLELR